MATVDSAIHVVLGSSSVNRRQVLDGAIAAGAHPVLRSFTVERADIDERDPALRCEDTLRLPLVIARAKSRELARRRAESGQPPCLLICADQVVVDADGVVREKPADAAEAMEVAAKYAGRHADTHSAVYVLNTGSGKVSAGVEVARVFYDASLSELTAEEYTRAAPAKPVSQLPFSGVCKARWRWNEAADEVVPMAASRSDPAVPGPPGDATLADPMHCAGGMCIEHEAHAKHIRAVEGTWCSVYGLPWALLVALMDDAVT